VRVTKSPFVLKHLMFLGPSAVLQSGLSFTFYQLQMDILP
jgi:hypothetical protein